MAIHAHVCLQTHTLKLSPSNPQFFFYNFTLLKTNKQTKKTQIFPTQPRLALNSQFPTSGSSVLRLQAWATMPAHLIIFHAHLIPIYLPQGLEIHVSWVRPLTQPAISDFFLGWFCLFFRDLKGKHEEQPKAETVCGPQSPKFSSLAFMGHHWPPAHLKTFQVECKSLCSRPSLIHCFEQMDYP